MRNPFRRRLSLAASLSLAAAVLLAATVLAYALYFPSQAGAEQPIPFSHRFHVGEKGVSCVFCHPGVVNSDHAGVPPLETCMLCHQRIIPTHPQIVRLREHYDAGRPVEWVRVTRVPKLVIYKEPMPDFVFFSHEMHVRRAVDCGRCHGNVAAMDRVHQQFTIDMGFCVKCHRAEGTSTDCLICHR